MLNTELWSNLKLDAGTIIVFDRLEDGSFRIVMKLVTSDKLSYSTDIAVPPNIDIHQNDSFIKILESEIKNAYLCINEKRKEGDM